MNPGHSALLEHFMPSVAVVIVTWNKRQYVLNLLASLAGLEKGACTLHVTVVDNASTDDTVAAIAEQFPGVHVIRNAENLGGTGGFNTGLTHVLRQGGFDYCWLLDNDVEVDRSALVALVQAIESDTTIGVVGSQVRQLDNPDVINETGGLVVPAVHGLVLRNHRVRAEDFEQEPAANQLIPADYCAASSLLVRRAVLERVGLWKDFFIHFDDVEWCLRVREAGFRVVCNPRSVIWHLSADGKPITWILYYDVRNYLYLLRDHYGPAAVTRALRRYAVNSFKETLRGRWHVSQLYLRGVRDYLRGRMGRAEGRLLDEGLVMDWQSFLDQQCQADARVLTTSHFSGRPEAGHLAGVAQRVGSMAVWVAPGDEPTSEYLPTARRITAPPTRIGRGLAIVRDMFGCRRPYDIGLLPHDKPSLLFNRRCRRMFLVVEQGVIPIDTRFLAAIGRCRTLAAEWWQVWSMPA